MEKAKLDQLAEQFVMSVRMTVAEEMQEKLKRLATEFTQQSGWVLSEVPATVLPPVPSTNTTSATTHVLTALAAHRHALHPHCVHPECKNPHSGPRFHWLCKEHRGEWKKPRRHKRNGAAH